MCKFAVNSISARVFVLKFVGVDSNDLDDSSSIFKTKNA